MWWWWTLGSCLISLRYLLSFWHSIRCKRLRLPAFWQGYEICNILSLLPVEWERGLTVLVLQPMLHLNAQEQIYVHRWVFLSLCFGFDPKSSQCVVFGVWLFNALIIHPCANLPDPLTYFNMGSWATILYFERYGLLRNRMHNSTAKFSKIYWLYGYKVYHISLSQNLLEWQCSWSNSMHVPFHYTATVS